MGWMGAGEVVKHGSPRTAPMAACTFLLVELRRTDPRLSFGKVP